MGHATLRLRRWQRNDAKNFLEDLPLDVTAEIVTAFPLLDFRGRALGASSRDTALSSPLAQGRLLVLACTTHLAERG